jgi:Smr domain
VAAVSAVLPTGHVVSPEELVPASGPLAETLVVAGLPLADLPAGVRLRIGQAVLELLDEAADHGVTDVGVGGRPRAARVLAGGIVRAGDAVAIEAVVVPLEDSLDLHPFAPADIPEVVREYLARAREARLTEVRLIHGRGRGVQRDTVRRVLAECALVAAFADAPPERGGWGATIARLRP